MRFIDEPTNITEFRVGDIFVGDNYEWRIISTTPSGNEMGTPGVHIECEWTGVHVRSDNLSSPRNSRESFFFYAIRIYNRRRYIADCERTPCYDSDCECIYSQGQVQR